MIKTEGTTKAFRSPFELILVFRLNLISLPAGWQHFSSLSPDYSGYIKKAHSIIAYTSNYCAIITVYSVWHFLKCACPIHLCLPGVTCCEKSI